MTLNTMNAVGKNLRDILSTELAVALHLLPRAGAAAGADAGFEVDAARGLPVATPSVLPGPASPPPDDDDEDDDVSLSVVRSVDDEAL